MRFITTYCIPICAKSAVSINPNCIGVLVYIDSNTLLALLLVFKLLRLTADKLVALNFSSAYCLSLKLYILPATRGLLDCTYLILPLESSIGIKTLKGFTQGNAS